MTETQLMLAILDSLGQRPDLRIWRVNAGAARTRNGRLVRFGMKGQADLSGILRDGRRLELEVKTATGRLRPEQRVFGEVIRRMGGVWAVVRSVEEAHAIVNSALGGASAQTKPGE